MLLYNSQSRNALITEFQWAPTLGGECYKTEPQAYTWSSALSFNGHPPLGVNATDYDGTIRVRYHDGFNGHPPLGVNATV